MNADAIKERQTAVSELLRPELDSDVEALRTELKEFRARDMQATLAVLARYAIVAPL